MIGDSAREKLIIYECLLCQDMPSYDVPSFYIIFFLQQASKQAGKFEV